ncbi:MAG: HAD-superfamily hydrolase subfamily variant 3 [Herbinix sp.]|nr:HAD-superfamily hydrolase subfamily variant 3 [Herbinix sp.]
MINTIILDIGNVLGKFRWSDCLQDLGFNDEIIRKVGNATVLSKTWLEWDRGTKEEEELISECVERDPSVAAEIKEFFLHQSEWVNEYDYSAAFINTLKTNGYKVYLLSNYSRGSFQYVINDFKFYPCVDGGVISHEIQKVKPEPEMFEALIQKYGFNPKEAVFLDDMQVNLEGAKPFGIHTIQFIDYESALEELRKLGVRI